MHNGYVRQGWILLINPTGYIVPPAADIPRFPPLAVREDAPLGSVSVRLSSARPFLATSYSPLLYRHERYPFVGMSCVAGYRAASVRRYYITLIMRACAKGGTGASRFLRVEKNERAVEARRRSGELP